MLPIEFYTDEIMEVASVMDIFSVLSLLGGLALFLYGMNVMGAGLEKISGGKLESILQKMTNNPLKGVLLGAGVTAIIQSSSATTVIVVGFVNSGIMKLSQAIGIIMGANIGTTVTAWILSLSQIEGESFFLNLLKPDSFSPILALIGVALIMFSKDGRKKDIGGIFAGFAVLMFGMSAMSDAVKPLADVPEFANILLMFSNPVLGILAGAVLTAIIQSSSASVGILQALTITNGITYGSAIPIILGQNIGTCATALISCIGARKNAKRAALVHLYFNIIGSIVFLTVFYGANAIFKFSFIDQSIDAANVAVIHTAFNVFSTVILLPFNKGLEKLAKLTIREKDSEQTGPVLEERFLNTPAFAIEQCKNETVKMAVLARDTLIDAISVIGAYDVKKAVMIEENEKMIDLYEDKLGTYLVKVSSRSMTEEDSREASKLLHSIGDFERIGDHAVNILRVAKEMRDKNVHFSDQASTEICVMTNAVTEILNLTVEAFEANNLSLAAKIEPLEQVIDGLKAEIKMRHVARLKDGTCTIELGFILSDLITNYERVSDHCSNIAVCLIQIKNSALDTHGYLDEIRSADNVEFNNYFKEYKGKYLLPS